MEEHNVQTVEYRLEMQEKLAKDFWFMNYRTPDPWDENFNWAKNCFTMEWGNGWLDSFYNLCRQLLVEVKSDFHWIQLKEKFGGARCYYVGTVTPYGEELIRQFEVDMESVCEYCGKPGELRTKGWWIALCDECYKKRKNGRTE